MDARWAGDPLAAFGPDWEDGVPRVVSEERDRVGRLKALGNAIVPQVAYMILLAWDGQHELEILEETAESAASQ